MKTKILSINSGIIFGGLCLISIYLYQTNLTKLPAAMKSKSTIEVVPVLNIAQEAQSSINYQTKFDSHNLDIDRDSFKQNLIQKLIAHGSEMINDILVQLSLMDLRSAILESYPEDGIKLFEEVIRAAFPQFASEILDVIAHMDLYDAWLLENTLNLNEMNFLERDGLLWAKRNELFGEKAQLIWSEELTAKDERQSNMQEMMASLNVAYDTDINERLYRLRTAMEENYSDTIEGLILDEGMLSKVFLGFESVQKDLRDMDTEERQAKINEIRQTLGYQEEQVSELAKLDQKREKRWQNGYGYMAERESLIANYSGDILEQKLSNLRDKFFKREAETIMLEEQQGFFRYQRPRLYGRN